MEKPKKQVCIRISPEIIKRAKEWSKKERRTFSNAVDVLLFSALELQEKKEKHDESQYSVFDS